MFSEAIDMFSRKNRIVIGYDLGEEYAQISVLTLGEEEPETVSPVAGGQQFLIPLILCRRREANQWFYGREALRYAEEGDGILFRDLLGKARRREKVAVGGDSFEAVSLLALFMKRSLSLVPAAFTDKLEGFMLTVAELDHEALSVLNEAVSLLQFKTDKLLVQSHVESFYEYTVHQPPQLWQHQVVVFDFTGAQMKSCRMECNRHTAPVVAFIDEQAHPKLYKQPFLSEKDREEVYAQWDRHFCEIAGEVIKNRLISCVYLIGDGFAGDWYKESLKLICRGRRVFQGNNLYSKGACFGIQEIVEPTKVSKDYVFLGREKIKANIGMRLYRRGEPSYYALLDAGTTWFEAAKSCAIILDRGNSFSLLVTPVTKGAAKELEVILDGLAQRERGTTRLRLEVKMVSADRCRIEIEDLGFGEIVPATHKRWVEEFKV